MQHSADIVCSLLWNNSGIYTICPHLLNFPTIECESLTSEGYTFAGSSGRRQARDDCCCAWTVEYNPLIKALWAAMMPAAIVYRQSLPSSSSAESEGDQKILSLDEPLPLSDTCTSYQKESVTVGYHHQWCQSCSPAAMLHMLLHQC